MLIKKIVANWYQVFVLPFINFETVSCFTQTLDTKEILHVRHILDCWLIVTELVTAGLSIFCCTSLNFAGMLSEVCIYIMGVVSVFDFV